MKKIFCFLIICLLVYTIYYFNHTDKITYISLGDFLSVVIDIMATATILLTILKIKIY